MAAATALLLAACAPGAAAAAPTPDDWAQDPRDVTAATMAGGFQVRSARDSSQGDDVLQVGYDARAARLGITLDAQQPERAAMASALTLLAVHEFRDADADGLFDAGEEVVRRITIPGTPAVASVEELPDGGWRATTVHALPAPPPPPGVLPLRVLAQSPTPGRLHVEVEAHPDTTAGRPPTSFAVRLRLIDAATGNGTTHLALEATVDSTTQHDALSADLARLTDDGYALATLWDDVGAGEVVAGNDPLSATFMRSRPAGDDIAFPATLASSWSPSANGGMLDHVPAGSAPIYVGAALVTLAALAIPAWRRLKAA